LTLLKAVCEKRNVVGFDAVELCPDGTNKAPDFLAAKLIYKLLSYKFRGPNAQGRFS
jgi:agmatinase